jgi:hypothetical protein
VKNETFVVPWGNKENRDNDDTLIIKTDDNKHRLVNVEVLKDANGKDLGVKWYFNLARDDDGGLKVKFFENGELVATGDGHYDDALPTPAGQFEVVFRKGGWMGERIELSNVSGYGDVVIHKGNSGGNTEADFVVAPAFLKTVFGHINDAYGEINKAVPWNTGPLVPVTAAVRGQIDQPVLKPKDLVTDDNGDSIVAPKFVLWRDGDVRGLESKSLQVFFKTGGSAERLEDWNFQGGTRKYTGNDFAIGVLDMAEDRLQERRSHHEVGLGVPARVALVDDDIAVSRYVRKLDPLTHPAALAEDRLELPGRCG